MRRAVLRSRVRLGLDDPSGHDAVRRCVDQSFSEQRWGNIERGPIEPGSIRDGRPDPRPRRSGGRVHRGRRLATSLGTKSRATYPITGRTLRRNTPTSTESFMALYKALSQPVSVVLRPG